MEETVKQDLTLKNNYLKQFILRVDLFIGPTYEYGKVIESISSDFDRTEKRMSKHINLNIQNNKSEVSTKEAIDIILISEKRGVQITFSEIQSSFWLDSTKYRDNSIYKTTLEKIQTAFSQMSTDIYARRIGMRYINEFPCPKPKDISRVFKTPYSTVAKAISNNDLISRAIAQEEYALGDNRVKIQYGVPNKFFPGVITNFDLLLDIDSFQENLVPADKWSDLVRSLNHAAYSKFVSIIEPKFLEDMK